MKQSNIFVYWELSKFVDGITTNVVQSKQRLKSQASYFNTIPSKYFSDELSPEWESIIKQIKLKGAQIDNYGKDAIHGASNVIEQMSPEECASIANMVIRLNEKVKQEFE